MKNKVLLVLTIASVVALMQVSSLFGQATSQMIAGELTPDIRWQIENNTLYIRGNGVIQTTMYGTQSAWQNQQSLFNSVVIEDGIKEIGKNVFLAHKRISSLTIGGNVRDIGFLAFSKCKNLSVVEVKGAIPPDLCIGSFYKLKFKKAKLIVPAGTKATYLADPIWSKFGTIEESVHPPTDGLPAPVETLAEPCLIHLRRTSNFVGGGINLKVFLNGVEQPMRLGNGQTILLQTDRNKNVLYFQQGKYTHSIRRFNATSGGDVRIEYSHWFGYMQVIDEKNEE